jgi:hypothetical protein
VRLVYTAEVKLFGCSLLLAVLGPSEVPSCQVFHVFVPSLWPQCLASLNFYTFIVDVANAINEAYVADVHMIGLDLTIR